jgi:hypothetical protein
VALDAPLNQRQIDILRWISEGCQEERWPDHTYKTTAAALEWRGLVAVSKRGGVWNASILPAGTHYLVTGNYPPGHKLHRVRSTPPATAPVAVAKPLRQRKLAEAAALKPTHQLVKNIVDAGGILERNIADDDTNYKHLVSIINRRQMAPDSQQVILHEWLKPDRIVLRLSGVSRDWRSGFLPERIGRWHPVVAELRTDKRLDHVSAALRPRAFRLLHALAREADARRHGVSVSKRPNRHGYGEPTGGIIGCLVFEIDDVRCALAVSEPQDRVPHVATAKELEKAKRDTWYRIPTHDYVKSGRLHMTLATDSGYSSKVGWEDTAKLRLESRLCDVMPVFERWAAIDAERKAAERQRQIAARERREREDEIALEEYRQRTLGDQLIADVNAWELAGRLRAYLNVLRRRVDVMADQEERVAAVEWLEWCEQYVAEHDPATKSIAMPTVRPPGYGELAEFRKRLGFSMF